MVAAERRVLVKPWVRRNAAAHGSEPSASRRPRSGRSSIILANAGTKTHRSAAECSCLGLSPGCGLCPYRGLNKDPPLRGLHCGSREAPAPSRRQCKSTIIMHSCHLSILFKRLINVSTCNFKMRQRTFISRLCYNR